MSTLRRTSPALLLTALLLAALAPITSVQAQIETPEYYYGVEYDWSSLDSDLQNVTGLDIQEIFSELMDDADAAGFNLDLGQLTTGASNVYVHQTVDNSVQTVQDFDGNDVQVWSRTSDVVLRHGLLNDAVIMTDWTESTFGSDPTGFDIDIILESENVLTVDMIYKEYLDSDYNLIGADMDFDMMVGHDMNLGIDVMVEGGGEELNIDFDTGVEVSYSIASDAVWRLGSKSPIYITAAANDRTLWGCTDEATEVGVSDRPNGDKMVADLCGMADGSYIGSADYNVYLTGLPMEEFGFDEGQFDITISDELTSEGDYEGDMDIGEVEFNMDAERPLEVDLGDGATVDVAACSSCPPGNPVMFIMMGNVIAHSSESFGEAVAEDFEAELEDSFAEIFGNILGGDADEDDNYDGEADWFMCDDGEMIEEWYVNDGSEDCMDGSDEDDFFLRGNTGEDWETGVDYYGFSGRLDATSIGLEASPTIQCYSDWEEDYIDVSIGDVNDGWDDCDDGSDEYDNGLTSTYVCLDGSQISFELVNDGTADCADASDEPVDTEGKYYSCSDYNGAVPWQWVNDGTEQCDDGSDEYNVAESDDYYCEDSTSISFELVNDGTEDCTDGSDEGEGIYFLMDMYMNDGEGNILTSGDDLLVCTSYFCEIAVSIDSGYISHNTEVPANMAYGDNTMCAGGSIFAPDGALLVSATETCEMSWLGPEIQHWDSGINDEGDNTLRVMASAGSWGDSYDDITMQWSVSDADNTVIDQGSVAFSDESEVYVENYVDIAGEGEYCLSIDLVENGQTEPFDSYHSCMTVEDGPEVSDKIMTIGEALADSGLVDVLQAFGENVGATFEDVAENEVPVFPYNDAMWAPLWSNEQATIVGVGVYAWDEDGNGYIIAGPATTGYSEDRPMTFASIRYITGVPAQEAQQEMAEFDDLADIVDVENHDLGELEQVLEDAGADTSGLGFDDAASTGGDDTAEEVDEPETAEEVAEDSGLLPFVSPLTVIALIGLAAVAGNRRTENE